MRKPNLEIDDERILFRRIRAVSFSVPKDSHGFIAWLKLRNPNGDFHHCFGSAGSLKSTDFLGVVVPHDTHMEGEESIDWLVEQMPFAVENLVIYTAHLEDENEELRKKISALSHS